jgi:hypothetical protein
MSEGLGSHFCTFGKKEDSFCHDCFGKMWRGMLVGRKSGSPAPAAAPFATCDFDSIE